MLATVLLVLPQVAFVQPEELATFDHKQLLLQSCQVVSPRIVQVWIPSLTPAWFVCHTELVSALWHYDATAEAQASQDDMHAQSTYQ